MKGLRRYIPWKTEPYAEEREHQVVMYTKDGCHLCEEAYDVLMAVREDRSFVFEMVDITTDKALMDAYGELIPVILINGEERFRYRINEKRLRQELKK